MNTWYCLAIITILLGLLFNCQQEALSYSKNITQVQSIYPHHGQENIHLYSDVFVTFKHPVISGEIKIHGVPGISCINGYVISFCQMALFKPGRDYEVSVTALLDNEDMPVSFTYSFTTTDMKDEIWVEVDLSSVHLVRVFKGEDLIRVMIASGGKDSTPTVFGTFFISDRGSKFFSSRFNEGALYWVRFHKNYLFHSIPRDENWNKKEGEEKKIGGPASHGCVRLLDKDAKWFYENIPEGTMIIIHKLKNNPIE